MGYAETAMLLPESATEHLSLASLPLRMLPAAAGLMGLVAVVFAGGPYLPCFGGLLLGCALALELGGWGDAIVRHGRSLAYAAILGAGIGLASFGAAELSGLSGPQVGPDAVARR